MKQHNQEHIHPKKKFICNYCSKAWDRPSDLGKEIGNYFVTRPDSGCAQDFKGGASDARSGSKLTSVTDLGPVKLDRYLAL